jgi:hypothetical protein
MRQDMQSAASHGAPQPPITGESGRYGPPFSLVIGGRGAVTDGLRSYVNAYGDGGRGRRWRRICFPRRRSRSNSLRIIGNPPCAVGIDSLRL